MALVAISFVIVRLLQPLRAEKNVSHGRNRLLQHLRAEKIASRARNHPLQLLRHEKVASHARQANPKDKKV